MPYNVGIQLSGKYVIYNFGVGGYGTHQMLAAIEQGLVTSIVKQNVRYVIYPALYPSHVYRLAGLRDWGKSGPKYVLGKDRQPYLAGHFEDNVYNRFWVKRQLHKSVLIKKFMMLKQGISETDKDLFVAMVIKSK